MKWMIRTLSLMFFIVSGVSCANRDVSSSHSFRIYSEGAIEISETTLGPKYEGELFEYVEVLRLNQDDSVEESLLGMPRPYVMDQRGYFYVPDYRPPRIVCFNAEGEFSHTIGRQGEGPGEYTAVEILKIADGIVTLFDSRKRRTTRFNTDGTLIDLITTDYQKTGPARGYFMEGLYEDGTGKQYSFWNMGNRDDEYQYTGVSVTAHDAAGAELFSIETPLIRTMFNFDSNGIQGGSGLSFGGSPVIRHLDDGRFIRTTGETPEIDLFSNDGDLIGRIVVELPRESTAQAEVELREYYREIIRTASNPRSQAFSQAILEDFQIPEYKAYWSDVQVDENGFFWLLNSEQYYGTVEDVLRWRILSPEGEYLGNTQCMATEARISRGHLLTIQENEETGAQDLIVYKIHPLARGLRYP